MEGMNVVTVASRLATAEDLETHKPTIERLYVCEKKTLQQVINAMVQEHGLKPTYDIQSLFLPVQ